MEGRPRDSEAVRRLIMAGADIARFNHKTQPPQGVEIALDVDRYDFAIRVRMADGWPVGRIEAA